VNTLDREHRGDRRDLEPERRLGGVRSSDEHDARPGIPGGVANIVV
jgi:hypothetical protein